MVNLSEREESLCGTYYPRVAARVELVPFPTRVSVPGCLDVDYGAKFLHRGRALVQPCFLFRGQFDLDDLLDALRAQFYWHAHVEAADAVLALQIRGTRQNLFLVFQDCLDHFGRGS